MNKYGYNSTEIGIMLLTTTVTNLYFIPGIIGAYSRKHYYNAFIGSFTCFTSFMYHLLDTIGVDMFIVDEGHWHRLDNLGSISSLITIIIFLMDNQDDNYDE